MTNMDQKQNQNPEKTQRLYAEIKKTWGKLSDDDAKLSQTDRGQFFVKLQEKQNVSKEDGERKLQELEKSCGCGISCSSEKSDAVKAA